MFDVLLIGIGLLSVLYLYLRWEDNHFTGRGVKSPPTYVPFIGHMMDILRRKEHMKDWISKMYKFGPGET